MRLKSFHGPTMADAMRQVRDALGEDAIIVATRDDDAGGVRVTAAIEEAAPKNAKAAAPPVIVTPGPTENDLVEQLADILYKHGAPATISEKILATALHYAADDPLLALSAAFDAHFRYRPLMEQKPDKPIMFVGPPGAGKTLCTAKIATMGCMKKHPVCAITTDVVRAGGIDQLAAFTNLLKVKLLEIEDPHALRDALAMHGGNNIVVIDTAGRNIFDQSDRNDLKAMMEQVDAHYVLVMPAGYEPIEGTDMAKAFREIGVNGILFTRLDMTRRLGSMLAIAHDAELPMAGISRSLNVTEPLRPLNPIQLAHLFLPELAKQAEPVQSTGTHA